MKERLYLVPIIIFVAFLVVFFMPAPIYPCMATAVVIDATPEVTLCTGYLTHQIINNGIMGVGYDTTATLVANVIAWVVLSALGIVGLYLYMQKKR